MDEGEEAPPPVDKTHDYGGQVLLAGNCVFHFALRLGNDPETPKIPGTPLFRFAKNPIGSEGHKNFHESIGKAKRIALLLANLAPDNEQFDFTARCIPYSLPLREQSGLQPSQFGATLEKRKKYLFERSKVFEKVLKRGQGKEPWDQNDWVPFMMAVARTGSLEEVLTSGELLEMVLKMCEGRVELQLRYHSDKHNYEAMDAPGQGENMYEVYVRLTPEGNMNQNPHGIRLTQGNSSGLYPLIVTLFSREFTRLLDTGRLSYAGPPNVGHRSAVHFYAMGLVDIPGQTLAEPPVNQYHVVLDLNIALQLNLEMYYQFDGRVLVIGGVPIGATIPYNADRTAKDLKRATPKTKMVRYAHKMELIQKKDATGAYTGKWKATTVIDLGQGSFRREEFSERRVPPPPPDPPTETTQDAPTGTSSKAPPPTKAAPPRAPRQTKAAYPKAPPPEYPRDYDSTERSAPSSSEGPSMGEPPGRPAEESKGDEPPGRFGKTERAPRYIPREPTTEELSQAHTVIDCINEYSEGLRNAVANGDQTLVQQLSELIRKTQELLGAIDRKAETYMYEKNPDARGIRVPRFFPWKELCDEVKEKFQSEGIDEEQWLILPMSGYWRTFKYILMVQLRYENNLSHIKCGDHLYKKYMALTKDEDLLKSYIQAYTEMNADDGKLEKRLEKHEDYVVPFTDQEILELVMYHIQKNQEAAGNAFTAQGEELKIPACVPESFRKELDKRLKTVEEDADLSAEEMDDRMTFQKLHERMARLSRAARVAEIPRDTPTDTREDAADAQKQEDVEKEPVPMDEDVRETGDLVTRLPKHPLSIQEDPDVQWLTNEDLIDLFDMPLRIESKSEIGVDFMADVSFAKHATKGRPDDTPQTEEEKEANSQGIRDNYRKWFQACGLPTVRDPDYGDTSSQILGVASYNLGNLLRPPRDTKTGYKKEINPGTPQDKINFLIYLLASSSSHVILLCEADGIQEKEVQDLLKKHHWVTLTTRCFSMAILVRDRGGMSRMKILRDTCPETENTPYVEKAQSAAEAAFERMDHESPDREKEQNYESSDRSRAKVYMPDPKVYDSSTWADLVEEKKPGDGQSLVRRVDSNHYVPGEISPWHRVDIGKYGTKAYLWYFIVEVQWNLPKGGMTCHRFCVFHAHNEACTGRTQTIRNNLFMMMRDISQAEVDFLGGDANASIYRCINGQPYPNFEYSSLNFCVTQSLEKIKEKGHASNSKAQYQPEAQLITSLGYVELQELQRGYERNELGTKEYNELGGPDTMVLYTFGWNHSIARRHPAIYRSETMINTDRNPLEMKVSKADFYSRIPLNEALWLKHSDHDSHVLLSAWITPYGVVYDEQRSCWKFQSTAPAGRQGKQSRIKKSAKFYRARQDTARIPEDREWYDRAARDVPFRESWEDEPKRPRFSTSSSVSSESDYPRRTWTSEEWQKWYNRTHPDWDYDRRSRNWETESQSSEGSQPSRVRLVPNEDALYRAYLAGAAEERARRYASSHAYGHYHDDEEKPPWRQTSYGGSSSSRGGY